MKPDELPKEGKQTAIPSGSRNEQGENPEGNDQAKTAEAAEQGGEGEMQATPV